MQRRGFLVARFGARRFHTGVQLLGQVFVPAFEEQAHRSHCLRILLVRGKSFNARAQTTVDVIFEAWMRMLAREIDVARRDLEVAMNKVHKAMRQVGREVRPKVGGSILAQAPRDIHPRVAFGGELDVGVGFIVPQQDVVARLPLLDEVVFECERFLFVIDLNEVDLARFAQQ